MRKSGVDSYDALHRWSVEHPDEYWRLAIERLEIRFERPFRQVLDVSTGIERPRWLRGAKFNIVESCFPANPNSPAVVHQPESGELERLTYAELEDASGRMKIARNVDAALATAAATPSRS